MQPELIAGRYRVRRAVGRGGMGAVWLCHDEVLGREVAVKQVGRLPGESLSDTARALREARSSAALNHRNVVSVFDVVEDANENWLVMEYLPSRTLAEIVREDGPLPAARVARIGAQVADGLAAAHAAGTVHRDVKPGNVLVTEGDLAKIGDFGIARPAGDSQLTQTGLLTGTPAYFSPELARGSEPAPESDVWALGATLYAAVEGRPPYPAQRNALAMLSAIASEPPRPLSASGPLAEGIRRMMDPDPAARWSMADAAHALSRMAGERSSPFQEGETALFAAPAISVPVSPAASGQEPPPSQAAQAPPPEPRAGRGRPARLLPWLLAAAVLLAFAATGGYLMLADGESGSQAAAPTTPPSTDEPSSGSASPTRSPGTSPGQSGRSGDNGRTRNGPQVSKAEFIESYFDTVPEDTATGWTRLAPSMKSVGRGDYEAFWGSIASVEASGIQPVAGAPAVEVTLTYTFSDGRVVTERQRITLQHSPRGYLIADDTVLSSRTVRS